MIMTMIEDPESIYGKQMRGISNLIAKSTERDTIYLDDVFLDIGMGVTPLVDLIYSQHIILSRETQETAVSKEISSQIILDSGYPFGSLFSVYNNNYCLTNTVELFSSKVDGIGEDNWESEVVKEITNIKLAMENSFINGDYSGRAENKDRQMFGLIDIAKKRGSVIDAKHEELNNNHMGEARQILGKNLIKKEGIYLICDSFMFMKLCEMYGYKEVSNNPRVIESPFVPEGTILFFSILDLLLYELQKPHILKANTTKECKDGLIIVENTIIANPDSVAVIENIKV